MRRAVPAAAAACLLAGPTVLAFWSGGYFDGPRLIAALLAWAFVLALAVVGPAPLPRSLPGRLAIGGLVVITAWSALSITWAPLRGPAVENVERLLLYLGAALVAIRALRSPRAIRAVEPALAAGAVVVIGYGLAGRLVPGLVTLARSRGAEGRLEQPLTYWNAEGALAAMGLVLCARLASDRSRPLAVRCLAAAATAPLGAGIYLSYSRGALAAAFVGLAILVALTRSRAQLEGAGIALACGGLAAIASSFFPGVASLSGDLGARERDGAIMTAVLLLVAAGGAALTAWGATRQREAAQSDTLGASRRFTTAAIVGLAVVGLFVGGLLEKGGADTRRGATAARLTSTSSDRYDYWRIGLSDFRDHPLEGVGSGGFRVSWLRERPIPGGVLEVHSLELEMAAELGVVGLLGLAAMILGIGLAAGRALRRHEAIAAGWCAALLVWLLQASIDWHWQMPAVTLPAIALAGALVALADESHASGARDAPARTARDEEVVAPDRALSRGAVRAS